MMNISKSLLLAPICGPQLMPETENGAGALQLFVLFRQVATPVPCSPPTTKAPFTSFGITATHFAPSRTCFGTPLSGAVALMCSTTSVACCNSELPAVLASFWLAVEVWSLCAQTKVPRQTSSTTIVDCHFIVSSLSEIFDSLERGCGFLPKGFSPSNAYPKISSVLLGDRCNP